MRKAIVGFALGAALAGGIIPAVAAVSDSPNDRRDAITCPKTTTEDARFMRAFDRLADGRARVVFACPSN